MESREEGVRLWLERSGALPINLSLMMINRSSQWFFPGTPDQATQDLHVRFIESLIQYSRRWKCLLLSHIPAHAMEPFNALTRHDLPLLEEFRDPGMLRNSFGSLPMLHSDDHTPPFVTTVGSLPSLRNLRITLRGRFNLSPQFQWGRLTVLRVTSVGLIESLEFVSSLQRLSNLCPLLSECTLSLQYPNLGAGTAEAPASIESQEWQSLRKLNLTLTGGVMGGSSDARLVPCISRLFESITVPALTRLSLFINCSHIEFGPNGIPSAHPSNVDQALHNLIVRSQCELTHLDLSIPSWDNPGVTLDALPSLVALNVDISLAQQPSPNMSNGTFLLRNIAQSLMSVTCPVLEQFSITSCVPEDTAVLVDLVNARARGTPLKSLRAKFGVLSAAGIRTLTSASELAKSKGLGGKIEWEFSRQKPADYFDYPYPLGVGSADTEVLSA
ncbi:hypothetical protein V5O48_015419 [Marasmius crinis-equi]|uniref:F-box domain-containing protein n=1 Tax=Marasmius crinis-equi TaxID=585013 RepID=A0ABR3EUK3_9AGAR